MYVEDVSQNQAQRVMFYMGVKPDAERSLAEGRPIFVDAPFIKIFTAGDAFTIIDKPVWDDATNQHSHTQRFPREWAAFKAGVAAEAQSGGTPLKLMPGISQAQVRELEHFHCHTIEQLVDLADSNSGKFMGIQSLKNEARAYMQRAKGAAPEKAMQRELEKRDQEIELLKSQMQQLLTRAETEETPGDTEAKPKRTRVARSA